MEITNTEFLANKDAEKMATMMQNSQRFKLSKNLIG